MSSILEKITDSHNRLSDQDFIWFPYQFLKPKAHEIMDGKKILTMTFFFSFHGTFILVLRDWYYESLTFEKVMINWLQSFGLFFLWFKLVTSSFWNIRARNLTMKKEDSNNSTD